MALRLIGTATTDVNGNAVLEDGYTGTGAGMVDIIAQTTIDGSTVQSTPYTVTDAIFYDKALSGTGNHNDNWINSQSATVTRGTDGTTISKESYATYFADNPSISAEYDWTAPFTVEVDIISTDGVGNNVQIYDIDHNSNASAYFSELGVTGNNALKIVCSGSTVKYYVDGVEKTSSQVTATFDKCRCGLVLGDGGTIKYKDFRIYPI